MRAVMFYVPHTTLTLHWLHLFWALWVSGRPLADSGCLLAFRCCFSNHLGALMFILSQKGCLLTHTIQYSSQ